MLVYGTIWPPTVISVAPGSLVHQEVLPQAILARLLRIINNRRESTKVLTLCFCHV